jgi:predicted anti-sigma-YlaC factor YlaD
MNCERFRRDLSAYLRGGLSGARFAEMVDHEGECPICHRLATEDSARPARSDLPTGPAPDEDPMFLQRVLEATTGADCAYVEERLAARLDLPIDPETEGRLHRHLAGCASCRRMRDVLQELPSFYAEWPVLRADRALLRRILDRTTGREPSFLEVLRALWRRPEAIWEATVVCALLTLCLFGHRLPSDASLGGRVNVAVSRLASVYSPAPSASGDSSGPSEVGRALAARPAAVIRRGWVIVRDGCTNAENWIELVGTDLRTLDYQGLLREIRTVTEPLGLYPHPSDDSRRQERKAR